MSLEILRRIDLLRPISPSITPRHVRFEPTRSRTAIEPCVIAVADAYNAMTSDRPYRDAMPSQVARMRLAQAVESQFDTSVAAAFEAILTASDEDYRSGTRFDFGLEGQKLGDDRRSVPSSLRAAHVA